MVGKVGASVALVVVASLQSSEWTSSAVSFFAPTVELSEADRSRLRTGRVRARTIDASDQDLAVFVAGSLDITPEVFVERVQDIVALRQSRLVPLIGRFSDPPAIEDLANLTLDDKDIEDLIACRPGDCGMKLSEPEIRRMRAALAEPETNRQSAALTAFREILLLRVQTYLAGGLRALAPYHDQRRPVDVAQAFDRLVRESVYLERVPRFRSALFATPGDSAPASSFLYWAVEDFGVRPVIRVTHVLVVRPQSSDLPDVIVGSVQVYASHYVDAALAITAMSRDPRGPAYLGYLYRARVDSLTNFIVRWIVERRLRNEVETAFSLQLERLEELDGRIGALSIGPPVSSRRADSRSTPRPHAYRPGSGCPQRAP